MMHLIKWQEGSDNMKLEFCTYDNLQILKNGIKNNSLVLDNKDPIPVL